MFKNIEYDLINISKQMEALDCQKEVELLVQINQNSMNNLIIDVDEYKKILAMAPSILIRLLLEDRKKSIISDISSVISL